MKLGWTPGLIELLLGEPDKIEHHRHAMRSCVEHLYVRDRAAAGMKDPRFEALLERRRLRAVSIARRQAEIPQRYNTWKQALPEACAGMFNLNRYAKHGTCGELHKIEIYRLKNELIEVLYGASYCSAAWIHRLELPAKVCRECGGEGGDCDHCGNSGIYQAAKIVEFWCFRFEIEGKPYCWHQPRGLVKVSPRESVPPQAWEGLPAGEKPLAMPKAKFAAVKELLRWVIDRAIAEKEEQTSTAAPSSSLPLFEESIPF